MAEWVHKVSMLIARYEMAESGMVRLFWFIAAMISKDARNLNTTFKASIGTTPYARMYCESGDLNVSWR